MSLITEWYAYYSRLTHCSTEFNLVLITFVFISVTISGKYYNSFEFPRLDRAVCKYDSM
jgi:hypothetical protein